MPHEARDPGPDDRARVAHMLDAERQAMEFVSGRSRMDLDQDHLLRRGLINAIQEIGEAAARTTDVARARCPSVPWGQIVQMRHVLVHVYWGIDLDRVWATATDDLPPFRAALESALAEWESTS